MAQKENIVVLNNGTVEAVVLPQIGGRIVSFGPSGGVNLLKSDPAMWADRAKAAPMSTLTRWKPYNGHIVWVGPQSAWWTLQNVDSKKRDKKSTWPPDPYLEYGSYEIIRRTPVMVELAGPSSDYTGVRMTKRISLENNKLQFTVSAENVRKKAVAWDLWLNTRVDGRAKAYVSHGNPVDLRVISPRKKKEDPMPWHTENGYFTFDTSDPPEGKKQRWSKAYVHPDRGFVAAFSGAHALVLRFQRHKASSIHPEQALVEIYNCTTAWGDALMELEYHAPYRVLQPGESMSARQTWELHNFKGGSSEKAHAAFLDSLA